MADETSGSEVIDLKPGDYKITEEFSRQVEQPMKANVRAELPTDEAAIDLESGEWRVLPDNGSKAPTRPLADAVRSPLAEPVLAGSGKK